MLGRSAGLDNSLSARLRKVSLRVRREQGRRSGAVAVAAWLAVRSKVINLKNMMEKSLSVGEWNLVEG